MLNPSTADAQLDDPTIRRCRVFSRRWNFDGLTVVNLFALRATDPRKLKLDAEPVGPENDFVITDNVHAHAMVVAAWGAHGSLHDRARAVRALLRQSGAAVHHLGLTSKGDPKHPLYLAGDTVPQPWDIPA